MRARSCVVCCRLCLQALEIEPGSTRALIMRGCLKLLNKTLELGVRDLTEAADKDPSNPLSFFNRAVGFHMLGLYHQAIADYSIVLLYSKGQGMQVSFSTVPLHETWHGYRE